MIAVHNNGRPFTVGDLRRALEPLPDYLSVRLPDGPMLQFCVDLHPDKPFIELAAGITA